MFKNICPLDREQFSGKKFSYKQTRVITQGLQNVIVSALDKLTKQNIVRFCHIGIGNSSPAKLHSVYLIKRRFNEDKPLNQINKPAVLGRKSTVCAGVVVSSRNRSYSYHV